MSSSIVSLGSETPVEQRIVDPTAQQLTTNSLEQHHRTDYFYPCFELLEEGRTDAIPEAKDWSNRYEPIPLIPNRAVALHSSWGNPELGEWSYYTLHPLNSRQPLPMEIPDEIDDDDLATFLNHMEWARSRAGTTQLRMLTVQKDNDDDTYDDDEANCELIIKRVTTHWERATASSINEGYYVLNRDRFTHSDQDDESSSMHGTIRELLLRTTDRATKHFNHCLNPTEQIPEDWKPRREVADGLVKDVLQANITPTNTQDLEDKTCIICTDEITEPVALPCNPKHKFCHSCLATYVGKQVGLFIDRVNCPLCRQPFVQDNAIRTLQFGLSPTTGEYNPDARYNTWENFERGCADLDDRLAAEHTDVDIALDPDLLMQAWDNLAMGNALEPTSSTPLHLQPGHAPEMRRAREIVSKTLDGVCARGAAHSISTTYCILVEAVMAGFWADLVSTGLSSFLRQRDFDDSAGRPVRFFLRPGLEAHLRRLISRTLMMVHLRRCERLDCREAATARGALTLYWHFHGGREFYTRRGIFDPERCSGALGTCLTSAGSGGFFGGD